MKKVLVVLISLFFIYSCNVGGNYSPTFSINFNYLDGSESVRGEFTGEVVSQAELWIRSVGSEKPMMTGDKKETSLKVFSGSEVIEIEVDKDKEMIFWLKVRSESGKDFVGSVQEYITGNTTTIFMELYETEYSKLNSSAEEWDQYLSLNF